MYPIIFEELIDQIKKLPGVGSKTAERYAFTMLSWTETEIEQFIKTISKINDIQYCKICGNLSETNECNICSDQSRDSEVICVVQQPKDIIAIEKSSTYKGKYHVLNGEICASKGIMPSDLNIESLKERVNESTKEVILATNPTVEGETTALYLAKLLEKTNVKVTRIAHGIPMGGHLDYADELTLIKAMEGRKEIN